MSTMSSPRNITKQRVIAARPKGKNRIERLRTSIAMLLKAAEILEAYKTYEAAMAYANTHGFDWTAPVDKPRSTIESTPTNAPHQSTHATESTISSAIHPCPRQIIPAILARSRSPQKSATTPMTPSPAVSPSKSVVPIDYTSKYIAPKPRPVSQSPEPTSTEQGKQVVLVPRGTNGVTKVVRVPKTSGATTVVRVPRIKPSPFEPTSSQHFESSMNQVEQDIEGQNPTVKNSYTKRSTLPKRTPKKTKAISADADRTSIQSLVHDQAHSSRHEDLSRVEECRTRIPDCLKRYWQWKEALARGEVVAPRVPIIPHPYNDYELKPTHDNSAQDFCQRAHFIPHQPLTSQPIIAQDQFRPGPSSQLQSEAPAQTPQLHLQELLTPSVPSKSQFHTRPKTEQFHSPLHSPFPANNTVSPKAIHNQAQFRPQAFAPEPSRDHFYC